MTSGGIDPSSSNEEIVFESVSRLFAERAGKEGEAAAWLLGSEVARDTGLDKDAVHEALTALDPERLHTKMVAAGTEVEVLGITGSADLDDAG